MSLSWRLVAACGLVLVIVGTGLAQPPGFGGGFGGGFGRGGGDRGGGDRGGGPGGFLSRMDSNGNGFIDPEEAQGPASFFLRRLTENNPSLDLSRPIPLDRLNQEFAAMRERFGGGGGPPGGGPPNQPSSNGSGSSSSSKPVELLVPGFDGADGAPLVPGFGTESQEAIFSITVTDDDRREAERRFRYYDRNSDGVIDEEEISRSRYANELDQYDKNNDNKLTVNELALRYAKRRIDAAEDSNQSSSSSSNRSSPSSSGSQSSGPRADWRSRFGGGSFGNSGGERGGFSFGGGNDRDRGSDRGSDRGGDRSSSSSSASRSQSPAPKPYRSTTTADRLAKLKLDNWFMEKDKNQDGQVAMAEFGSNWTESLVAEFRVYDLNNDGVITPDECLRAKGNGAARPSGGESFARSSAEDRGGTSSQSSDESSDQSESNESSSASSSANSASSGKIDDKYLAYASSQIRKYDKNGDGVLQPDEWSQMSRPPDNADTNGDKQITAEEYAISLMPR